jgi:hypothetical protein
MSAFLLHKWVIKKIDQIQCRFLWHGHKETQINAKPMHVTNWALVTRARRLGGLGVRDLQHTNVAFLLKWM